LFLPDYITVYSYPPQQSITQTGDTLFALSGAAYYQWYYNGNAVNGATDYFYVATLSGDYNVVATDNNGCEVEAVINDVIAYTSPFSFGEGSAVRVYPNPVDDKLYVTGYTPALRDGTAPGLNGTATEISIYNLMGEKIKLAVESQSNHDKREWVFECQQLPAGMYYLEIRSEQKTYRVKFLKQ
jgi:hypothetical protein